MEAPPHALRAPPPPLAPKGIRRSLPVRLRSSASAWPPSRTSAQPLGRCRSERTQWATATTGRLPEIGDGPEVAVGGIVVGLRFIKTKKGDRMASFLLEDLEGEVDTLVFPETYKKVAGRLADDQV